MAARMVNATPTANTSLAGFGFGFGFCFAFDFGFAFLSRAGDFAFLVAMVFVLSLR